MKRHMRQRYLQLVNVFTNITHEWTSLNNAQGIVTVIFITLVISLQRYSCQKSPLCHQIMIRSSQAQHEKKLYNSRCMMTCMLESVCFVVFIFFSLARTLIRCEEKKSQCTCKLTQLFGTTGKHYPINTAQEKLQSQN